MFNEKSSVSPYQNQFDQLKLQMTQTAGDQDPQAYFDVGFDAPGLCPGVTIEELWAGLGVQTKKEKNQIRVGFRFSELLNSFKMEVKSIVSGTTEASVETFHRHILFLLENFALRVYQIPSIKKSQLGLFVFMLFSNLDVAIGQKHPYLVSTQYQSINTHQGIYDLLDEWGLLYKTDFESEEDFSDI